MNNFKKAEKSLIEKKWLVTVKVQWCFFSSFFFRYKKNLYFHIIDEDTEFPFFVVKGAT